ncbi:WecB/TagA/CpsF family glycosyltransferase [Planotetraspora sp. A-T 1434]|uniref:WecB/TagA/CpsF family glycosyltransferase n=1 Tax=Planotetraspora sp. A-T 1434 TaxID=2979219 RepID=UPI0021BF58DA|nr:WecB/TagA/CpsF family glycosyltransferase [Planotetraspora sp. A-T 1434]MCT9931568.1 WecB/TagA/CpsF family glycosyltransferase [Planotetraspora sp. A-T 1434]
MARDLLLPQEPPPAATTVPTAAPLEAAKGRPSRTAGAAPPGAETRTSEGVATLCGAVAGDARVAVAGVELDALTEAQVVQHVVEALHHGRGGHIVTPNVDICRAISRDAELRELVASADLAVADGMPLVWAARLLGDPLPARVTGADLIWSLSEAAASHGFPIYLLGGPPGVPDTASAALRERCPQLVVAGVDAPPYGFDTCDEELAEVRKKLVDAGPLLVFVGLGFPKQDRLIAAVRADLPGAWFVGCGSAIAFAAGSVRRAPAWMGDHGLEWLFRLLSEPGRLARRYLIDDLPFALRLLTGCLLRRREPVAQVHEGGCSPGDAGRSQR